MFQIVPKQETRFWRLFRHLLIPLAVFSGLICLVTAVVTACGEQALFWDDRPVTGLCGVLLSLACFPVFTLIMTLTAAWVLYLDRRIFPALRRALFFGGVGHDFNAFYRRSTGKSRLAWP